MEPCYLYVVFSSTNSGVAKFIRVMTRNFYNHTSVAVDPSLKKMYSFARRHKNAPFISGFITEKPGRYLDEGQDITIKICKVPVDEKTFRLASDTISRYRNSPDVTYYNYISALTSVFRLRLHMQDCYTCVEFSSSMIGDENTCVIHDLEKRLKEYVVYEGSYKKYIGEYISDDKEYFTPVKQPDLIFQTVGLMLYVATHLFLGLFRKGKKTTSA